MPPVNHMIYQIDHRELIRGALSGLMNIETAEPSTLSCFARRLSHQPDTMIDIRFMQAETDDARGGKYFLVQPLS